MRNLLAIDAATRLGWAAGIPGDPPIHGSFQLPTECGLGFFLLHYREWLAEQITKLDPGEVVIEAPIGAGRKANQKTSLKLNSLVGVTALMCEERRIFFDQLNNSSMKKYFAGSGSATKTMMMDAADLRGWAPQDHNAADALAAWEFRIHTKRPDLAANYSLWRRQSRGKKR